MNTQQMRIALRFSQLMPLKNEIEQEKKFINENVAWSPFTTFISPRPVLKEIVFYYLLHFNQVDFVRVFTAEEVKDIYMNKHPDYESIYDIQSPFTVVLLGSEVRNKLMIDILNLFSDAVSRGYNYKGFIYAFSGSEKEFAQTYCNAQERGLLNIGTRVVISTGKTTRKYTRKSSLSGTSDAVVPEY